MAVTKELLIELKQKYDGKSFDQLKNDLKDTTTQMKAMVGTVNEGGTSYKNLQTKAFELEARIKGLNREFKGQSAEVKMSIQQIAAFGAHMFQIAQGVKAFGGALIDVTAETVNQGAKLKVLRENYKGTAQDLELLNKAAAGTLTESQLIPIYNKATEQLQLTSQETARLLAYSEDLGDKGIGDLTSNFDALTKAVLTGGKGLNQLGISQKQFKDDLKETATQMGIATGLIEDGSEADEVNISKLDAKTQKMLVLKTLFDGGYIPSLENVLNKEQDSADKLEAVKVKFEEAKSSAGIFILQGIEPLIDKFLGLDSASNKTIGTLGLIGSGLLSILPLVAQLRIAIQGLQVSFGAFAIWGAMLTGLIIVVTNFVNANDRMVATIKRSGQEMMKNEQITEDAGKTLAKLNIIADNTADAYAKIEGSIQQMSYTQLRTTRDFIEAERAKVEAVIQAQILMERARLKGVEGSPYGSVDDYMKTFENTQRGIIFNEKINQLNNLLSEVDSKIIGGKFNDSNSIDVSKGVKDSKGSNKEPEKLTTDLSRLQEQLTNTQKEFEKVKSELTEQGVVWDSNTLIIREYQKAIEDLQNAIDFKKLNLNDLKLPEAVTNLPKYDNTKPIEQETLPIEIQANLEKKKKEDDQNAIISSEQYQNATMILNSLGDTLRNSLGQAWEDTFGEANSLFEKFMQQVTTALINSLISKAITGILNLIFPGSGIAVGAIAGRATGGNVQGGTTYMTGEKGMELFTPSTNGYIHNNKDTMNILKNYSANNVISEPKTITVNKYFTLEQDGIKFLEKNYPHYKSKRLFRQL